MFASPAWAQTLTLDQQLARFLAWLPGEYDNHEQVWQNQIDQVDSPHERTHHIVAPVAISALGEHSFFVQQTRDDDPQKIHRIGAYTIAVDPEHDALVLSTWFFTDQDAARDGHLRPESLATLSRAAFRTIPGCQIYWRWQIDRFVGATTRDACRDSSPGSGQTITTNHELELHEDAILIREVAVDGEGRLVYGDPERPHHLNRKVRYFDGWAALRIGGRDAAADAQWTGVRGLRLHSEGDRIALIDSDGKALGYTVELARLTYQNTTTPILKLAVIDDATGKSIGYAWGEPGARRLGINLGWFQTGFTEREGDARFGW